MNNYRNVLKKLSHKQTNQLHNGYKTSLSLSVCVCVYVRAWVRVSDMHVCDCVYIEVINRCTTSALPKLDMLPKQFLTNYSFLRSY